METEETDYTPSRYLKKLRERIVPELSFSATNETEFIEWQARMRERLTSLLGGFPKSKCELHPRELERVETQSYTREKVVIESDPGCFVPMYVFVPKGNKGTFPAVLAIHGHGRGMRDVAGLWDSEKDREAIEQCSHDYGRRFAEKGCMVFAPEMMGFGERREADDKLEGNDKSSCRTLSWHAVTIGRTAIGIRVWDVIRTIDYAETRHECDTDRGVGCVGFSGGGTVTLFSSAFESRIRCAIISGYFNTFEDSILAMPHCDCNYVPGIRRYAEMWDIASMIAPRPLLIESGVGDDIFPIEATKAAYAKVSEAYKALGVEEKLDIDIHDQGHRFSGRKAFDWMDRWMTATA